MTTALESPSAVRVRHDDEASWLAWRTSGIGASECAAALGVSPYATPFELYQRKIGAVPPVEPTEAMEIGLLMEKILPTLYARKSGREIVEAQVSLMSRERPWLRATLDGVASDGRVVELKTAGSRMAAEWGEPGTDEIPPHYLCQVHQQLLVSGAEVADLAVLIGGQEFRLYTIGRDARLEGRMLELLEAFWGRVERRDPPAATDRDAALIRRIAPEWDDAVELGEEEARIADTLADLRAHAKAIERLKDKAQADLILRMGGHALATLPDGRRISRKQVDVKEHISKAYSRIDFRVLNPKARD